jgi:hypothetical protein
MGVRTPIGQPLHLVTEILRGYMTKGSPGRHSDTYRLTQARCQQRSILVVDDGYLAALSLVGYVICFRCFIQGKSVGDGLFRMQIPIG